jgi:hypothetical protein
MSIIQPSETGARRRAAAAASASAIRPARAPKRPSGYGVGVPGIVRGRADRLDGDECLDGLLPEEAPPADAGLAARQVQPARPPGEVVAVEAG